MLERAERPVHSATTCRVGRAAQNDATPECPYLAHVPSQSRRVSCRAGYPLQEKGDSGLGARTVVEVWPVASETWAFAMMSPTASMRQRS